MIHCRKKMLWCCFSHGIGHQPTTYFATSHKETELQHLIPLSVWAGDSKAQQRSEFLHPQNTATAENSPQSSTPEKPFATKAFTGFQASSSTKHAVTEDAEWEKLKNNINYINVIYQFLSFSICKLNSSTTFQLHDCQGLTPITHTPQTQAGQHFEKHQAWPDLYYMASKSCTLSRVTTNLLKLLIKCSGDSVKHNFFWVRKTDDVSGMKYQWEL